MRYQTRVHVLGEDPKAKPLQTLRRQIRHSPVVAALLADRKRDGTFAHNPYAKWLGPHWALASLAALEYPPGDCALRPMQKQFYDWLELLPRDETIQVRGLYRRHASQEGNFICYSLALGLDKQLTDRMAANLLVYQWPDGGWNCDRKPKAHTSSFIESLLPLRALIHYHQQKPNDAVQQAIKRGVEFFLERRLFRRKSTGAIIAKEFVHLMYLHYYYYDIRAGLTVMAEGGFIGDERCAEALDLLESKFIPDAGWRIERKVYHYKHANPTRCSSVRWTDWGLGRANLFLTVEALRVLRAAGRIA